MMEEREPTFEGRFRGPADSTACGHLRSHKGEGRCESVRHKPELGQRLQPGALLTPPPSPLQCLGNPAMCPAPRVAAPGP